MPVPHARRSTSRAPGVATPVAGPSRCADVLDALPAGVVVLNGLGVVEACNPAARALFGEDPTGSLWREAIGRLFRPRPDDGPDLSLADGRRVNIATGAVGGAPGQVLLLQDVTDLRSMQARVSQLERLSAMGEMAAQLAHQIRTPLASAILYAGLLGERATAAGDGGRQSGRLIQVLRHLEALVRDMLLFARRGAFEVEDLDLDELLAALREQLHARLEARGVALAIARECGPVVLRGSRQALAAALGNLLDNACEAGAGQVTVTCARPAPGCLAIEVQDDGPGVPEPVRARVFDPFFTTRSGGSGLGLAVVRAVAEAHGGRAELLANAGAGARFRLELPLWERQGSEAAGGLAGVG